MSLHSDLASLRKAPPIPKGWATSKQIAKKEDIGISTAARMISELVAAGIWEKQPWPFLQANGGLQKRFIYRRKP